MAQEFGVCCGVVDAYINVRTVTINFLGIRATENHLQKKSCHLLLTT